MEVRKAKRSGRPVKYGPTTMVRVPRDLHLQIRRQLWPWESLSAFIRRAVKNELEKQAKARA